jgi:hypothetical protein
MPVIAKHGVTGKSPAQKPKSSRGAAAAATGGRAEPKRQKKALPHDENKGPGKALCAGKCECELLCPENQPLVDIFLKLGEELKAQDANRFSVRQLMAKDVCRVRRMTKPMDRSAVKGIAKEKGIGAHTLSVLTDYVEHPDQIRFVDHIIVQHKSHDEFDPETAQWVGE